jgi:hypothetical protein
MTNSLQLQLLAQQIEQEMRNEAQHRRLTSARSSTRARRWSAFRGLRIVHAFGAAHATRSTRPRSRRLSA